MNEVTKTLVFAVTAVVAVLAAWLSQPRQSDIKPPDMVGQMLFADFQDPGNAASLEIVRFNEDLGQLSDFEVKRDKAGRWTIPSHGGYPADAEAQMKDAANALIDLEVLGIASQLPSEHKLFGVVEPNRDELSASSEGVGTLVMVQDAKGGKLAELIVGGAVRGVEGQRFVRVPKQDAVYVVSIDPDKFSTKFEDWIEKDLLQLNAFDVRSVRIEDYSVVRTTQGFGYDPRLEIALTDDNGTWKLDEMFTFRRGEPVQASLGEGEEINKEKLDALKDAVDDLKIVDVRQKPDGLERNLTASEDFMNNREAVESLFQRGFFPLRIGDQPAEIRAANGEVHVGMKDGVEYVLRFGNIEGAGAGEGTEAGELNRYLFVTARLDESKLEQPQLEELPPLDPAQQGGDAEGQDPADAAEGDAAKADEKPADADEKPADEKSEAEKEAAAERKAERERIEKENQRKLDEYQEKLKDAQARVTELNNRFARWYYIISEDTYKKIHLGRSDILKLGEGGEDTGYGLDSFRKLEESGIDGPSGS